MLDGVEWVWLAWLVGLAVVLRMAGQALRRWRRPCWQQLARGEEGVSYTLSYVLTVPIYMCFVCLVFETSWLLLAKIGTLYAAHAGARSAVVWSTATPEGNWSDDTALNNERNNRIQRSVWTAMTPFVTLGTGDPPSSGGAASSQADKYADAYQAYTGSDASRTTLRRRYLTAVSRTSCAPLMPNIPLSGDVKVTVTYQAPLHIPGVSRFLDPNGQAPYKYTITSSATLISEAPVSSDGTLGIDYRSR
jgi:Flp pilus assembly protein TadG